MNVNLGNLEVTCGTYGNYYRVLQVNSKGTLRNLRELAELTCAFSCLWNPVESQVPNMFFRRVLTIGLVRSFCCSSVLAGLHNVCFSYIVAPHANPIAAATAMWKSQQTCMLEIENRC